MLIVNCGVVSPTPNIDTVLFANPCRILWDYRFTVLQLVLLTKRFFHANFNHPWQYVIISCWQMKVRCNASITLQALSLVEKAEPVQVRFTLCLRDQQSMWMQDGCKVYVASNGSCFMVTWTVFKNHLLEVGPTQNQETTAFGTLTTVDVFYFIMCEDPAWIKIHQSSIWLRAQSHMTSHYTWWFVTTLHDFRGVLGRPSDTFFWALTILWSRLLARCVEWPFSNCINTPLVCEPEQYKKEQHLTRRSSVGATISCFIHSRVFPRFLLVTVTLGRDLYVSGERRAAIWRAESRNYVKIVKNLY